MLTMWATAFYVMENYSPDMKEWDFSTKMLQVEEQIILVDQLITVI